MGGVLYNTPIISPKAIIQKEYDYILIAMYDFRAIREIETALIQMGVSHEKIKAVAVETEFMDTLMDERIYWIRDFARWSYMQGMKGNVAECGVYRGDSAKFINQYFPDKKLYLFDTFEGFTNNDMEFEMEINDPDFVNGPFATLNKFKDTDIGLVMKKMMYPENVIIRKGFFPESAEGINDKFCFVNLDMDLYQPMLAALCFFWDKIESGGCILLHDYFTKPLPGVKNAVEHFEKEEGIVIPKTPIGDGLSLALLKF